jgi:hypothetical protein
LHDECVLYRRYRPADRTSSDGGEAGDPFDFFAFLFVALAPPPSRGDDVWDVIRGQLANVSGWENALGLALMLDFGGSVDALVALKSHHVVVMHAMLALRLVGLWTDPRGILGDIVFGFVAMLPPAMVEIALCYLCLANNRELVFHYIRTLPLNTEISREKLIELGQVREEPNQVAILIEADAIAAGRKHADLALCYRMLLFFDRDHLMDTFCATTRSWVYLRREEMVDVAALAAAVCRNQAFGDFAEDAECCAALAMAAIWGLAGTLEDDQTTRVNLLGYARDVQAFAGAGGGEMLVLGNLITVVEIWSAFQIADQRKAVQIYTEQSGELALPVKRKEVEVCLKWMQADECPGAPVIGWVITRLAAVLFGWSQRLVGQRTQGTLRHPNESKCLKWTAALLTLSDRLEGKHLTVENRDSLRGIREKFVYNLPKINHSDVLDQATRNAGPWVQ